MVLTTVLTTLGAIGFHVLKTLVDQMQIVNQGTTVLSVPVDQDMKVTHLTHLEDVSLSLVAKALVEPTLSVPLVEGRLSANVLPVTLVILMSTVFWTPARMILVVRPTKPPNLL